jgi:uncharacterized membrane protein YvbJ
MLCKNCGRQINDKAPFCHHCGEIFKASEQVKQSSENWNTRPHINKNLVKKNNKKKILIFTVLIIMIVAAVVLTVILLSSGNINGNTI